MTNFKSIKDYFEAEIKALDILRELSIDNNPVDFVNVLSDETRLKQVLEKLKLLPFW